MRSSPFAPSRTALLLLPFFVIPAVVIFGTPTASTLKPDRTARSNTPKATGLGVAAANAPGIAESPLRRAPVQGPPSAGQGANRSQSLRSNTVTEGWTAAHAARPTAISRVRANPAEIVENRGVVPSPTEEFSASGDSSEGRIESRRRGGDRSSHDFGPDRPRPSRPSPRVRLGAPTALPRVVEGTAARAGSSGSQSFTQKTPTAPTTTPDVAQKAAEGEFAFPLGTSVSLADAAEHRAAGLADSSKRSFGGPQSGGAPDEIDKPRSSTGTVIHRAQEPDPPESLSADVPSALTWKEAQQRLQKMGASRYRLETWGGDGQFRFTCSVPLESNSPINRHFEARAADPMLAVTRVLDDIERWRQRK